MRTDDRNRISMICLLLLILLLQPIRSQTGTLNGYSRENEFYLISIDSSRIRLSFYDSDIARFDMLPSVSSQCDSSFVVIQSPSASIPVSVTESDSDLVFRTDKLRIVCSKSPFRISCYTANGTLLLEQPAGRGFTAVGGSRTIQFVLQQHDHFYSTGERGTSLDKRGERFTSYNTQIGGYSEPLGTMNLNVPFTTNPNGYALYFDNTYRGIFDFGNRDSSVFSYTAEGGELSWYCIAAPTIQEQLQKYTWLTGRQPLPPRWAFGYIQSKNRYLNSSETRGIVSEMRKRNFPCDAVVLDLAWFKHMGDISWDESAWPDHETMVTDFLVDGIKTILITEPYIIQPSRNFAEADSLGYLAKDSSGRTQLLERWWSCNGCNSSLLDLTNPAAQQWWWKKHPAAFGAHVAGIWTDLGEPEKHPESMKHALGSTVKIHNIYNLLWAKTIFEGFSAFRPNERVMNVTRSGFAGIQRYGVLPWSGDVSRSFGGLAVQLPMLLNMGMSGIAYHNSDLGGYARNPTTPELYVRWMQFGVFTPIARAHGAGETVNGSPTEPWMFGKEAETINRKFLELRYRLLPYNYSLAYRNYSTGFPLARPLFFLEPENEMLKDESSAYMWGDAFLVAPVVAAGERKKTVQFPAGEWTNYWTDQRLFGGGKRTVDAPLDVLPLFVKAGSIIPMAPVMRYSDERPLDTVTVHIYPDTAHGSEHSFTMYEDDGRSLEYQYGRFMTTTMSIHFERTSTERRLKFTGVPSQGTFAGQVSKRTYRFEIHHIDTAPLTVKASGTPLIHLKSRNEYRRGTHAFFYDARSKRLFVTITTPINERIEFTAFNR